MEAKRLSAMLFFHRKSNQMTLNKIFPKDCKYFFFETIFVPIVKIIGKSRESEVVKARKQMTKGIFNPKR